MKVLYRQTTSDDIVRQFRYYLLTAEAPEIALRSAKRSGTLLWLGIYSARLSGNSGLNHPNYMPPDGSPETRLLSVNDH